MRRSLVSFLSFLTVCATLLGGCPSPAPSPRRDSGVQDTGADSGSNNDTGPRTDASMDSAVTTDLGTDANRNDAASQDSAAPQDSGRTDATSADMAVADSGSPDAGSGSIDSGSADAGTDSGVTMVGCSPPGGALDGMMRPNALYAWIASNSGFTTSQTTLYRLNLTWIGSGAMPAIGSAVMPGTGQRPGDQIPGDNTYFAFNGMGELSSSTTPVSFSQLSDAISIEAWVYVSPTGTLTASIVDKNTPSTSDGFFFDLMGGRPRFQVGTQSITAGEADAVYANGSWTHLVGTWRAGAMPAMALYLDGAPLTASATGTAPSAVPRNSVPFRIGGAGTTETRMNGRIADVRIYCSALTAEQVRAVYVRDCYRIPTTDGNTTCVPR